MAEIAKTNRLRIARFVDFGAYLDDGEGGEILLPAKYLPEGSREGDEIEAFVYTDSEDRLVAVTDKPLAEAGDIVPLRVTAVSDYGAFLDWGLPKDLLLPFSSQRGEIREGDTVVVHVYVDAKSGRPVATSKWDSHAEPPGDDLKPGDECEIVAAGRTKLGYKALVNGRHYGLIFNSDVFRPLAEGDRLKAYVKNIRPDGKIDLSLSPIGFRGRIGGDEELILNKLNAAGGYIPVTDKTAPEKIYALFGISKRAYKQAVGALYRKRLVSLDPHGLRLL